MIHQDDATDAIQGKSGEISKRRRVTHLSNELIRLSPLDLGSHSALFSHQQRAYSDIQATAVLVSRGASMLQ